MSKLGCFVLLLGAFFVVLFVLSDIAKDRNFNYLVIGGVLFLFSLLFRRSKPEPPPESNRFRVIKQFRNRKK